jgi:hypothetical protein
MNRSICLPTNGWKWSLRPIAVTEGRPYAELPIEERLRRLEDVTGMIEGPAISLEALRREDLYDERV